MPTKEDVIEVLKTIEDPELFLDIWFLGLIYEIVIQDEEVLIEMTFTSPMCPAGPMLIEEVSNRIGELPEVVGVKVRIVFEPPWEPNEEVQAMLGML